MDDDRPPAEQPAAGAWPPPSTPAAPPPSAGPVVSWGPPSGTAAPVQWNVIEKPRLPPPPGTAYAGVGIRFVALILDLLPMIAIGIILIGPVFGDMYRALIDALPDRIRPGQTDFPEMQAALAESMARAIPGLTRASALFQIGGLIYIAGSWLVFSRTPGMALLGLRIVREEDGGRLDLARVAVRYGGYLLSAAPLLLGFAWAIFDNRNQAWHDKLAGTLVVRTDPSRVTAAPAVAALAAADGQSGAVESPSAADAPVYRRPSIGGVAGNAWRTFRTAPLDLFASLAIALVPATIILLPLVALSQVAGQDQAVLSLSLIGDAFNIGTDPASFAAIVEYNRRILASAAPLVQTGVLSAFLGAIAGSVLVGACAAAVDDVRSVRPAGAVTRLVVQRLPALLALGVTAGLLFALGVVLVGLPSLAAASADRATFDPEGATLGAVLGAFIVLPVSIYLAAIWLLAVVSAVREGLGPPAAVRRAWQLSRGRMRWLIGISVATSLGAYAILGPIGSLPLGLFAEDYFDGRRLPLALSVAGLGLLALLAAPVIGLTYVEAYVAARDEAAGGRVA